MLELILSSIIFLMFGYQLYQVVKLQRSTGNGLRYFQSGWTVVDFLSNTLMFICVLIWWDRIYRQANEYSIKLRYGVYDDLITKAYYIKLADGGAGLNAVNSAFEAMDSLISDLNW